MYAIIKTGGKQYRVTEGDTIKVEKIDAPVGAKIELLDVLMLSGKKQFHVGTPNVDGASVIAEVVDQGLHKKVLIFKHKRRKTYRRTQGHRQAFTALKISGFKGI